MEKQNQQKKGLILIKSLSQILKDLLDKANSIKDIISDDKLRSKVQNVFYESEHNDGAIEKAIKLRMVTNLPPFINYKPYFDFTRDGLKLYIAKTDIYLGGAYTRVSKKIKVFYEEMSVTLDSNKTSYIWLSRYESTACKIDVTDLDHGYNDDIHYSRILIARAKTDANSIIEITPYPIRNYPVFTG